MTIERLLQLCIAALVALSAMLLGMGQQETRLPILAVVVSAVAFYVVDLRGWWRLGDRTAALLSLIAVAFAFLDLGSMGRDSWLIAVANLLVYLQFILLFQVKLLRRYWLLMLLSVLEVAVATVVNDDLSFGFLQVVYLFLGATTLVLLHLHSEMLRLTSPAAPGGTSAAGWFGAQTVRVGQQVDRVFVAHAPVNLAERRVLAPALNEVALVCLGTLVMTAVVFLMVPRVGGNPWRPASLTGQPVVGASQSVRLGDLGDIIESPEAVMQVSFQSFEGGRVIEIVGEPLFRGMHLTQYQDGVWDLPRGSSADEIHPVPLRDLPPHTVRQNIQIEPLSSDLLYCLPTSYKIEQDVHLLYDHARYQYVRSDDKQNEQYRFNMATTGLIGGKQYPVLPSQEIVDTGYNPYEDLPPGDKLDRLGDLAESLVADIPASNRLARARRLESYFGEPGRFSYSLQSPLRDPALDPIDDFLFERPQGHCEYFATALALMLRSVGIPSRLVLGFKGGEWNSLGGFYQVRQLHAHAWVEAYLEPAHLPSDLPQQPRGDIPVSWANGGWLTLDPTIASLSAVDRSSNWLAIASLRQFTDYAQYLWSSYVVGLDANRQMEAIYQPIGAAFLSVYRALTNPQNYRDIWQGFTVLLGLDGTGWFSGDWFSWRGGLVGSLLAAGVIGAVQGVRRLWQRYGWRRGSALARRRGPEVEFYHRLESLLARFAIVRTASQTQREFATLARRKLGERGLAPAAALAPERVTEAFYRVRFGRADLDKAESDTVEQSLALLEAALPPRRGRHELRS
ncbi:MAG: DUF3488 domain-containing protein [Pirellulales bacterium]|nr:DUF3488 domain-containing protein [Pirellulales bacterium]